MKQLTEGTYYVLSISNETTIAGAEPGFDHDADGTQFDLTMWEFPDFEPKFSKLIFEEGNKMADFINASTMGHCGFIVSQRIKDLLADFTIMPHRFYVLPPYEYEGNPYQYYLLQIPIGMDDFSMIDFSNSELYILDRDSQSQWVSQGKYNANDATEFSDELDKYGFDAKVDYDKLVLNHQPYDIFAIHRFFDTNYLFSSRLKEALDKLNVTGLEKMDQVILHWNS